MARIVSVFVLAALAAGCLSFGRPFPAHRVSHIEIGTTTRDQIRSEFGEPWRTGLEDGDETWTYGRYVAGLGAARTADLKVRFDRRGVVASYTFSTTDPGP
jgi:hypothetical protein